MPPATTTTAAGKTALSPAAERVIEQAEAARVVATAARANARANARRAADTLTPRPAPTTLGKAALAAVPDPPLFADDAPNPQPPAPSPQPPRSITLSSAVLYRDYTVTISAGGLTLAAFGALLSGELGDLALPFRVTVAYGGRAVTIEAEGIALDRLCDMLDARLGVVS